MDFRLIASTFVSVFLAELGDKTQLATFNLAAGNTSRWSVFLGAAGALVATSAIGVVAGETIAKVIPPQWLTRAAGVAFVLMGAWMLYGSLRAAK